MLRAWFALIVCAGCVLGGVACLTLIFVVCYCLYLLCDLYVKFGVWVLLVVLCACMDCCGGVSGCCFVGLLLAVRLVVYCLD